MPSLYLDICALQRPLDLLTSPALIAEADAIEALLSAIQSGVLELVWSAALTREGIELAPARHVPRIMATRAVRSLSTCEAALDTAVIDRARNFEVHVRLKPFDALHLACAESVGAVLVTVDRRFLNRVRRSALCRTPALDPVEALDHFGL